MSGNAAVEAGVRSDVAAAMQRLLRAGNSGAVGRIAIVAGAPLHWLEEGDGEAVVLLHGGSGGGANWFRLLRPLSSRFRVLAPDLPGFGLSPPRTPTAPLGVAAAELLEAWLEQAGVDTALVVGTSFGGVAALRLAQRAPQRVRRLMLLDSAGLGRGLHPAIRLATLPPLSPVVLRPTRRGTARVFRTLLTSDRSGLDATVQQALVEFLHVTSVAAGTAYLARTLRLFAGLRGQREYLSPAELFAIAQPASVVVGERDSFFPVTEARKAAAALREARFHIITRAGHSPNWESPAAVHDAILELHGR